MIHNISSNQSYSNISHSFCLRFKYSSTTFSNNSSTPYPERAEHSWYNDLFSLAFSNPYYLDTLRYSVKSFLFPTMPTLLTTYIIISLMSQLSILIRLANNLSPWNSLHLWDQTQAMLFMRLDNTKAWLI